MTWMNLEDILLSEMSQTHKNTAQSHLDMEYKNSWTDKGEFYFLRCFFLHFFPKWASIPYIISNLKEEGQKGTDPANPD